MSSVAVSGPLVVPKEVPMKPLGQDPLTREQWRTLLAICDTVIPAIKPNGAAKRDAHFTLRQDEYEKELAKTELANQEKSRDLSEQYLAESASSLQTFRDGLHRLLGQAVPPDVLRDLTMVLYLLDTRAGSLFLTGYITPLADQPVHVRDSIMTTWATARIPLLRQLHRTLTMMSKIMWVRTSPTLPRILGFSRTPTNWKASEGYPFEFIQIPPGSGPEVLETDIVIVGSGCGAGVCAKNLAEAGHRVMVVEKAHHWKTEYYPMTEAAGVSHMFANEGIITSDDSTMSILTGQTWGGGGTVNWSASLQPQGYVREEWAKDGLPFFTSPEYQACLDRVCARMGVSDTSSTPNRSNQLLMEGARRLGWTHKKVPQNCGGNAHHCGYCTIGCAACEKQGPVNSWLPDAARAGAQFMEGFFVDKITFTKDPNTGEQIATGVRGTWTSRDINGSVVDTATQTKREVVVNAKRVIVSGGTMMSPLLLTRSGLKNRHIGRNLYLHPVQIVGAIYDEDISPWEGGILTSVVSEFENLDRNGHGVKLESTCMLPGFFLPILPWAVGERGGIAFKELAAKMRRMCGYIAIARDANTGRVYPDATDGRPRVDYSPSKLDRASILKGIESLARVCHAAGAREIIAGVPGIEPYIRPAGRHQDPANPSLEPDPEFEKFIADIRRCGLPHPDTGFPCAHQMGSCRMSSSPKKGVVDPKGRVWGTQNLFVADASVFPSASGVNPMISNMGISDWISRWVGQGLNSSSGSGARL